MQREESLLLLKGAYPVASIHRLGLPSKKIALSTFSGFRDIPSIHPPKVAASSRLASAMLHNTPKT